MGVELHKALIDSARRVWPNAIIAEYGQIERVHITLKPERRVAEMEMLKYTGIAPLICYTGYWNEGDQRSIVRKSEQYVDDMCKEIGVDPSKVWRLIMLWPEIVGNQPAKNVKLPISMVEATFEGAGNRSLVTVILAHRADCIDWIRSLGERFGK